MVDEEINDVSAGPTGAPVNRDARREPEVIEGEIAAREPDDSVVVSGPESGRNQRRSSRRQSRPAHWRSWFSRRRDRWVDRLGAGPRRRLYVFRLQGRRVGDRESIERARSAGAAEQRRDRRRSQSRERSRRNASKSGSARSSPAPESSNTADLEKRVAALEAASAGNGAASDATQRLATQAKDLRADVDAEKGALPELSARIAKLETEAQKANTAGPDLAALAARIDKVEAALAAPKNETRVAEEKPAAADNATTIAIIAEVAEEKLRVGRGFWTRARRPATSRGRFRGAGAACKPWSKGRPPTARWRPRSARVAPHVLAATSPAETGSVSDRFLAHLHNLVKVRELNETAGDDPQALVSQIEAASRRGDIGAALASFDKLPEAARKAAGDWPTLARARAAAEAALQSIREAAVGQLAGGPKP